MSFLSDSEHDFYARHFALPGFSEEKQMLLKQAKVLVIGAGGLGSPCLLYLSGAGVGTIGIADGDRISISNLPRQVIYDFKSVGLSKSLQAKNRIQQLNPHISVNTYDDFLNRSNIESVLSRYDIIIDCTDNFDAKYLMDEVCEKLNKPLVYASLFQFEGQISVFHYTKNTEPDIGYRDLFPAPPRKSFRESCNDAGVIGTLPGIIGTLQANEVIKIITGTGDVLAGKVLIFDALSCQQRILKLKKRKQNGIAVKDNNELSEDEKKEISVKEMMQWHRESRNFSLLDIRSTEERNSISLGGQHIPLNYLSERLNTIERKHPLVIYCKSGKRSQRAVMYLMEEGFSNVMSLSGGIISMTSSDIESLYSPHEYDIR